MQNIAVKVYQTKRGHLFWVNKSLIISAFVCLTPQVQVMADMMGCLEIICCNFNPFSSQ